MVGGVVVYVCVVGCVGVVVDVVGYCVVDVFDVLEYFLYVLEIVFGEYYLCMLVVWLCNVGWFVGCWDVDYCGCCMGGMIQVDYGGYG